MILYHSGFGLWGRKARSVKFRLGRGDGRGPEVYSHDRRRLVGWLDRSSRVVPNVLVWLAELREWRGRGPMSTPAGQRWAGHQWAERSEGQGVMG